jgi:hypothetical protein
MLRPFGLPIQLQMYLIGIQQQSITEMDLRRPTPCHGVALSNKLQKNQYLPMWKSG